MPSFELASDSVLGLLKDACGISYDKYIGAIGMEAVESFVGEERAFGGKAFCGCFSSPLLHAMIVKVAVLAN